MLETGTPTWRRMIAVDLRALAVLRIGIACLLLADLAFRLPHIDPLLTDGGWLDGRPGGAWPTPSLHALSGAYAWHVSLFVIAAVCALGLLVGWRTRLMLVLSWLLHLSLVHREYHMMDVGDSVLSQAMWWCLFLPIADVASLDARRRGPTTATHVCSVASLGLLLLPACVYGFAGLLKLRNPPWQDGEAVRMAIQDDTWTLPLGSWLMAHDAPLAWMTYATLATEVGGPLLLFLPLWFPKLRTLGVLLLAGFTASMGLTIWLGLIPFVMLTALIPHLPSRVWRRDPTTALACVPRRRGLRGVLAAGVSTLALLYVLLSNVDSLHGRHRISETGLLHELGQATQLRQGWTMYIWPLHGCARVEAELTLQDGAQTVVVMGAERDGWPQHKPWLPWETLWHDYRARMYLNDYTAYAGNADALRPIAHWIGRTYETTSGTPVASVRLVRVIREPLGSPAVDGVRALQHAIDLGTFEMSP